MRTLGVQSLGFRVVAGSAICSGLERGVLGQGVLASKEACLGLKSYNPKP